jgi:hypothetical protein
MTHAGFTAAAANTRLRLGPPPEPQQPSGFDRRLHGKENWRGAKMPPV